MNNFRSGEELDGLGNLASGLPRMPGHRGRAEPELRERCATEVSAQGLDRTVELIDGSIETPGVPSCG